MKMILTYPPDHDGELHVDIKPLNTGPVKHLQVTLIISQQPEESTLQTMRRLGKELANQPAKMYIGVCHDR